MLQVVSYETYAGALCLDGPTLTNLELLENTTGGTEGSLLARLDTCASPGIALTFCVHKLSHCHLAGLGASHKLWSLMCLKEEN